MISRNWPTCCPPSSAGSVATNPTSRWSCLTTDERVYNPPMSLLFQFHRRLETRAVSETSLRHYLDHALTATGITDRSGSQLRYTFHDLRRLLSTDAIIVEYRAYRPTGRRAPRHQHHHGIQSGLPRGGHQRAPGVHRAASCATARRGIPHAQ